MGDSGAMVVLGEMYSSGEGVSEDDRKRCNGLSGRRRLGNVSGMVALGECICWVERRDPTKRKRPSGFRRRLNLKKPAAMYDLADALREWARSSQRIWIKRKIYTRRRLSWAIVRRKKRLVKTWRAIEELTAAPEVLRDARLMTVKAISVMRNQVQLITDVDRLAAGRVGKIYTPCSPGH